MTNADRPPGQQKTRRRGPKFTKTRPPAESVNTPQRLFLAVPLPPDVRTLVERVTDSLKREEWPVRWAASANTHITLHFLGEIEPERIPILRLALRDPVSLHDAFALRTADLGVFPNMRRPRIIWLGLYGPAHRLQTLHDAVGAVLKELDFDLEERDFHPHITLGRLRDARYARVRDLPAAVRARFERATATGEVSHDEPVPIPVDELQLIRSHLNPEGAQYEVIDHFRLAVPTE